MTFRDSPRFVKGGVREVSVMEPPRIRDEYLEDFFDTEAGSESYLFGAFRYGARTAKAQVPDYYVYEGLCYVERPVDPDRQQMDIFVPAAYLREPGARIGKYTAETAPVLLVVPGGGFRLHGKMRVDGDELGRMALERGFIVAAPDIRGCADCTMEQDGMPRYTGTAPAQIVDLKAAVRYLRDHQDVLPGNYDRIVATGGSSGGAMTELLATSGNCHRFDKELDTMGAAKGRDDIQAAIPFCGPADLEHGDMAYDWFFGRYIYQVEFRTITNPWGMTEQVTDIVYGADGRPTLLPDYGAGETAYDYYSDYARLFVDDYLKNTLHMTEKGYVARLMQYLVPACRAYLEEHPERAAEQYYYYDSYDAYLTQGNPPDPYYEPDAYPKEGYIHFDQFRAFNGKVAFKSSPAFDQLEQARMPQYENALFGTERTGVCNFTDYGAAHSDLGLNALPNEVRNRVRNQNPISFLGDGESHCCTHWYIPHGTADGDIALCQSLDLVEGLHAQGISARLELIWNGGHSCGMVTPPKADLLDWAESVLADIDAKSADA